MRLRQGVTMMEILVVAVIMGMVSYAAFSGLTTGRRAADRGLTHVDQLGQMNRLLEHVKRALRLAVRIERDTPHDTLRRYRVTYVDHVDDAGVSRSEEELQILVREEEADTRVQVRQQGRRMTYLLRDTDFAFSLQQHLATITLAPTRGSRPAVALSVVAPFLEGEDAVAGFGPESYVDASAVATPPAASFPPPAHPSDPTLPSEPTPTADPAADEPGAIMTASLPEHVDRQSGDSPDMTATSTSIPDDPPSGVESEITPRTGRIPAGDEPVIQRQGDRVIGLGQPSSRSTEAAELGMSAWEQSAGEHTSPPPRHRERLEVPPGRQLGSGRRGDAVDETQRGTTVQVDQRNLDGSLDSPF